MIINSDASFQYPACDSGQLYNNQSSDYDIHPVFRFWHFPVQSHFSMLE